MKNTLQIYRFLAFLPNDFHAFLLYLIFFNQKGGDVNLFLLFLIDLTSPNYASPNVGTVRLSFHAPCT